MATDIPRCLQGALLRIRADHPFLGTLALFADIRITEQVGTAATDGKVIWFNAAFVIAQDPPRLCGLVVHELLHAALQHGQRRGVRDPLRWNIAADIVVNGMIRSDTAYLLPAGGVEDDKLAVLSVEEVYEQLPADRRRLPRITLLDLAAPAGAADDSTASDSMGTARRAELERHWRTALQQAGAVAQRLGKGFGRGGLGRSREFECASGPVLGWKALLWDFMVSTPFDFGGFDRRFVHRKLYIEDVVGEQVKVAICIDTSGSIGEAELGVFMAEIQGILDAYPQIRGNLFYADADLYGPYEFSLHDAVPAAEGGGGTSFEPFFDWVNGQERLGDYPLCIYFTDGYGVFPDRPPESPVLWVVAPGGLMSTDFPFGETARIDRGGL